MKKLLIVLICFAFLASPAYSKSKNKNQKESGAKVEKSTSGKMDTTLSFDEKRMIENFYQKQKAKGSAKGKKGKSLPKGLEKKMAKGGKLPPGWQRKVEKGKVLDREILQNSEPLPPELVKELPKQPEETTLVKVEDKIVRVLKATREVLDVFDINF